MAHNAYTFRYRVRNWRTYNQGLIARSELTFWIDEASLAAWKHFPTNRRRGVPKIYSETAIQCAFVVKRVYGLSLRGAQGFVSSVMRLMKLDLQVRNSFTQPPHFYFQKPLRIERLRKVGMLSVLIRLRLGCGFLTNSLIFPQGNPSD